MEMIPWELNSWLHCLINVISVLKNEKCIVINEKEVKKIL
jgi:hypothetical protein